MSRGNFALVGDIGGTNARFALVRPGQFQLEQVQVLPTRDYANLDDAVRDYLQQAGVAAVEEACMAFAGPVHGEHIKLTNNPWAFDKREMQARLGLRTFKLLNDFTAMALGVPYVMPEQLVQVGGGAGEPARARLVIGPGTGLGVSGLVRSSTHWLPLSTEGGHVDFAPTNDLEIDLLRWLRTRYERVSVERILCGEGMVNLYQALAEFRHTTPLHQTPAEVLAAALSGEDSLARDSLQLFCEIFGRVCGNAALTIGSLGGVYICGGIIPRFVDFFKQSNFRACFEDKGRMRSYLEPVPAYVVLEPFTGLLGAAEALINDEV